MRKKLMYIIGTAVLTIVILYIVDQILQLNYVSKVLVKLLLFSLLPAVYIMKTGDNFIKDSFVGFKLGLQIKLSHVLGILIFVSIMSVFYLIKQYMDIDVFIAEFEGKYQINGTNIVYYGAYLTFINSLLEEFFFRGFIFLNLKKLGMNRTAYFSSSIAFAIYHVSNIQNWFNPWIFGLATVGLFVGGLIFNFLDDKEHTFLNSWFVHICADLALVGIGLSLFHVI